MIASWFTDLPSVVQLAIEVWAVAVIVVVAIYLLLAVVIVVAGAFQESRKAKLRKRGARIREEIRENQRRRFK